jgi:hypothetical protein
MVCSSPGFRLTVTQGLRVEGGGKQGHGATFAIRQPELVAILQGEWQMGDELGKLGEQGIHGDAQGIDIEQGTHRHPSQAP